MNSYIKKVLLTSVTGLVALLPATGMDMDFDDFMSCTPLVQSNLPMRDSSAKPIFKNINELIPRDAVHRATRNIKAYINNGGKIDEYVLNAYFEAYPLYYADPFFWGWNSLNQATDEHENNNAFSIEQYLTMNLEIATRKNKEALLEIAVNAFTMHNDTLMNTTLVNEDGTLKKSILDVAISQYHFRSAIKLYEFYINQGGKINEQNIVEIISQDDSNLCPTDNSLKIKYKLFHAVVNKFIEQNGLLTNDPSNKKAPSKNVLDLVVSHQQFNIAPHLYQLYINQGGKINEQNIIVIMSQQDEILQIQLDGETLQFMDIFHEVRMDLLRNVVNKFIEQNGLLTNDFNNNNSPLKKNLLDMAVAHQHFDIALKLYKHHVHLGGKINEQNIIEIMSQKNENLNTTDNSDQIRKIILHGVVKTFIEQKGTLINGRLLKDKMPVNSALDSAIAHNQFDLALKLYQHHIDMGGEINAQNILWILNKKCINVALPVISEFIKQNGTLTLHHLYSAYQWNSQMFSIVLSHMSHKKEIPSQSVNTFLKLAHVKKITGVYNAIKLLIESGASCVEPTIHLGQKYPNSLSLLNKYSFEIEEGENIKLLILKVIINNRNLQILN